MNPVGNPFAPGARRTVARIVAETRGHPYFLPEWRKRAWDAANGDSAFSMPLFHELMRRILPGDAWRT